MNSKEVTLGSESRSREFNYTEDDYIALIAVMDILFPVVWRQEALRLHQLITAIMGNSSNSRPSVETSNSGIINNLMNGEDIESIKGHYEWKVFGNFKLPVIIRVVNGQYLNYICKRLVESNLRKNLNYDYLHDNIFKYVSVICQLMSVAEIKLMNDINNEDESRNFGIELFVAGQDSIVHEDAVQELYTFIDICYNKLLCINSCPNNEKCGYIWINRIFVVPYCIIDNQKYIPLFCFDDEDNCLMESAIKIENWDFAYLKLCLLIMDIKDTADEIYTKKSCIGTTLEVVMKNFELNVSFEEYFPRMVKNIQLQANVDGYIAQPNWSVPHYTQMIDNNYCENEWPGNQMVYSSYNTQSQQFPVGQQNYSKNVNVADQYYYTGAPIFQHVDGTLLTFNNAAIPNNNNIAPTIQPMTTMYNPMINSSVMPNSDQTGQFYGYQHPYVNFKPQQQYRLNLQQQHQQNLYRPHHQNRQYHHYHNNEQQDPQRLFYDESATRVSSLPLNNAQTLHKPQRTFHISASGLVLCKIPDRQYDMPYPAYKIQFVAIYGNGVNCINATPYVYGDFMMMLSELVEILLLRSCTIERCIHVLYKYFKIVFYSANHEQIGIFNQYNIIRSFSPDDTPMVMFKDIYRIFLQLKNFVIMPDEQIEQLFCVHSENIVVGPPQFQHNIYQSRYCQPMP